MVFAICNNPRQRHLIKALTGAVVLVPSCYFKRIRMFQQLQNPHGPKSETVINDNN